VDIFFSLSCFIFGLIIGSFLNVVILRLPDPEQSIVFPASHCPACGAQIAWYDNIPLLSYLILGGRCRHCRNRISLQYPLVELACGLLLVGLYLTFGLGTSFFLSLPFVCSLLVVIVIDIRLQIIPDLISLPGIALGFLFSFINPHVSWVQSGLGILVGGGSLYLVALVYALLTGREGMGGGDIKLLAMLGAFLGIQSLLFIVFASSITGSLAGILAMLYQKKGGQTRIPFGPFLSLAALAWLFFQPEIMQIWSLYLDYTAGAA